MKRIISLVLSVIMLFSMFTISAAADMTDTDYSEAESFAISFGIVDKATYNPNAYLTRAEFCELMYKLLTAGNPVDTKDSWQEDNFGDDTKDELVVLDDTKLFEDVDIAVPQYEAIRYMVQNGYMNGMTAKHFGPGYNVTVAAVAKVMVNVLGYDFMAQENGGFPGGYMYAANKIKILSGVKGGANDFITLGDCLNVFYNSLDIKLFEFDYISKDGDVYVTKGEDSFLTAGLGFVNIVGYVSDTGLTTAYGASKVGTKNAVIDGVTVEIGDCTEIRSCIGREVSAFCRYEKNGNKYTLKHFTFVDEDVVTFDSSDFSSFENGKITYIDKKGNVKSEAIASKNKFKVVYNGKAVSSYTDDIFSFPFGDITLISTNGGAYDLAVIRDYKTGRVSKVRNSDLYVFAETLYDGMDEVKYLNLDPEDAVVSIHSADGAVMDATALTKGSVISALVSDDGEYVDVIVSNNVVSGFFVDSISENVSDILYTNGTNEYTLSFKDELTKVPAVKVGKAYNLYLDHKGRLVYLEAAGEDTAGEKAAFITGVDYTANSFDTDYKIRLYTEEGLMAVYDFGERIVLNGDNFKTKDAFYKIEDAFMKQKAVLYTADTKTKVIKSITLPLEFGAEDTDHRGWYHISPDGAKISRDETDTKDIWDANQTNYQLKWMYNGSSFNKIVFWDKTFTKSMNIPGEVSGYDDERDFSIASGVQFFGDGWGGDRYYLLHAYSRDPKAMAADLIVYSSTTKQTDSAQTREFFIFDKLINTVDRDGEPVTQLTGYEVVLSPSSCKKVSYTVDENITFLKSNNKEALPEDYDIDVDGPGKIEELGTGDVLRIAKDSDGTIKSIVVNYDADKNLQFPKPDATKPFPGSEMNINVGYPLYISGTYVRMSDINYRPENIEQTPENLLDHTKLMAHNVAGRTVVVVENIAGRTVVREGTMDDIVPYEDTGYQSKYQRLAGILFGGLTIGTVVYKVTE